MKKIEVVEGLRVRFLGRSPEFDEGIEVGLILARMAGGERLIEARVSSDVVEQLTSLSRHLCYRVSKRDTSGGAVEVVLESTATRPKLRLVTA